jgi:hypothetical protein
MRKYMNLIIGPLAIIMALAPVLDIYPKPVRTHTLTMVSPTPTVAAGLPPSVPRASRRRKSIPSHSVSPSPTLRLTVGGDFARLRDCESGSNYATNTGNGFYGAYQFDLMTWRGLGYSGNPSNASPATQDRAAMQLQSERGWQPWPACSRKLGLR